MTIMIVLAGVVVAISAMIGYLAWRDRHGRRSIVDPAAGVSLERADEASVEARLAAARMPVGDVVSSAEPVRFGL